MTFTIKANKYIDNYFIDWLIDIIQHEIIKRIDNKRIHIFNNFINNNDIFQKSNPNIQTKFDVRKAIIMSLSTLRYRRIKNVYIIEIGKDIIFPNYKVKLDTICRLLNYGNVDIKGYPIFSETFDTIKSNIAEYYQQYLME